MRDGPWGRDVGREISKNTVNGQSRAMQKDWAGTVPVGVERTKHPRNIQKANQN